MSDDGASPAGRRKGNRGAEKDAAERRSFTEFLNGLHEGGTSLFTGSVETLSTSDEGRSLFEEVSKGVLFPRLINYGWPGSIDESKLLVRDSRDEYAPFELNINHQLAIDCARDDLELKVVNVGATDLTEGNESIVLGLLWQVIQKILLKQLEDAKEALVAEFGEELGGAAGAAGVKPEELILRWANVVLERMSPATDVRLENFGSDVADSLAYAHLLHALGPEKFDRDDLQDTIGTRRLERRAQRIIDGAYSVFGPSTCLFVNADDIVGGNAKLNFAFAAVLFNHRHLLPEDLKGGSSADLGHTDLITGSRKPLKKGTAGTVADAWFVDGDKTLLAEKTQLVWEHKSTGKLSLELASGDSIKLSRSDMQVIQCSLWDIGLVITRGGPYKLKNSKATFHTPSIFFAIPEEADTDAAEEDIADFKEWLDRCKVYSNKPEESELA